MNSHSPNLSLAFKAFSHNSPGHYTQKQKREHLSASPSHSHKNNNTHSHTRKKLTQFSTLSFLFSKKSCTKEGERSKKIVVHLRKSSLWYHCSIFSLGKRGEVSPFLFSCHVQIWFEHWCWNVLFIFFLSSFSWLVCGFKWRILQELF